MKYTIKKVMVGYYQILDEQLNVVAEFDSYNYQKPLVWAKEWIEEHSL